MFQVNDAHLRRIEVRHRPTGQLRGVTLLEVLLALSLSGSVAALAASVAVQSLKLQRAAERSVRADRNRMRLFARFEEDVQSALTVLPENQPALTLRPVDNVLLDILCLSSIPTADTLFRRRVPARVTYRRDGEFGSGAGRLIRVVQDLTDPRENARIERVVARDLVEVTIEGARPATDDANTDRSGAATAPNGVRIICRWAGAPTIPYRYTALAPFDARIEEKNR